MVFLGFSYGLPESTVLPITLRWRATYAEPSDARCRRRHQVWSGLDVWGTALIPKKSVNVIYNSIYIYIYYVYMHMCIYIYILYMYIPR